MFCVCSFSIDQSIIDKRDEEIKDKLREACEEEICEISGGHDKKVSKTDKDSTKNTSPTTNNKASSKKKIDYFQLVYECIHYRKNFLNIFTFNHRNPFENDIDLFILQALLNG